MLCNRLFSNLEIMLDDVRGLLRTLARCRNIIKRILILVFNHQRFKVFIRQRIHIHKTLAKQEIVGILRFQKVIELVIK